MVDEATLSQVLSEFARTVITDFPIQGILDHLVERIVDVLPVTGTGVTLIAPGDTPQYVAASDAAALAFVRLQSDLGEGPCLLAYETGEAVAVPDLRLDDRFPRFGPAALSTGMGAVFTFPLRHGAGRLGALDLYRGSPGPLSTRDLVAAQTLADVTAAYLINARARELAQQTSDRFREGALHDGLTGLPNRVLLHQRIEHAAARAHRSHSKAAVLFVDLDHFKQVNDTRGHAVGDELLVAVGRRLTTVLRPGDTLARVSGDEFVILCEDIGQVDDVTQLAQRVDDSFARAFALQGGDVTVSASVGIAYSGPGEGVSAQLVTDADQAMYQAKHLRAERHRAVGHADATHHVLDLRSSHRSKERDPMDQELRSALVAGQLSVVYQPIVRTEDGVTVGVEALVRWPHPLLGPVPALTVIGLAERSGLIDDLGGWVLERGCRDRTAWLASYPDRPLDLSVNVSVHQLTGPGFSATVASVLSRTGMDPAGLVLEVTEGVFIEDGARALTVLAELKALGVRIALDDFGSGYCSLGYLRRFPVDIVKIDRAFVADIGRHPSGSVIIAAVSDLAHVLGLSVTAEGVETEEQHRTVAELGCEHAQGFRYGHPMPAAALLAGLPEQRPHGCGATPRRLHAIAWPADARRHSSGRPG